MIADSALDVKGLKAIGRICAGTTTRELDRLLDATRSTLNKALGAARAGSPLNVIYNLTGHGIGRSLHENPRDILIFHHPDDTRTLQEGLVLAIEPFLTTGIGSVVEEKDGWALRTMDRAIAAQLEHTTIVTKDRPIVLTI